MLDGEFVLGDLADRAFLDKLSGEHQFDSVMHFAFLIQVGEAVQNTAKYCQNNLCL